MEQVEEKMEVDEAAQLDILKEENDMKVEEEPIEVEKKKDEETSAMEKAAREKIEKEKEEKEKKRSALFDFSEKGINLRLYQNFTTYFGLCNVRFLVLPFLLQSLLHLQSSNLQ